MPLDVDAPAPGATGELGVLPRRDVGVGLAVPLRELLDHHRPRGHVDAQRQRLGREHDPAQAAQEQLLDALLERGQHAGVVGGDAAGEAVEELVVAEHLEVLVGDVRAALLDELEDLVALLGRGQAQVGVEALLHRRVAPDPAEDEHDRGQQRGPVELLDDLAAAAASTRHGCPPDRGRAACRRAPGRRSRIRPEAQSSRATRSSCGLTRGSRCSRSSSPGRCRPRRRTGRTSACPRSRAGRAAPGGAPRRSSWSRRARCPATRRTPRRC